MRIAIDPIATPVVVPTDENDNWKAVPVDFLPALAAAKKFTGQTASYRLEGQVAFLHSGKVYATNNQVVIEFDIGPNDLEAAAFTPKDIATLIAFGPPSEMRVSIDTTEFRWADRSTFLMVHADQSDPARYGMRQSSKYTDIPSPDEVAATVENLWTEPTLKVTDDWRQIALSTFSRAGIEVLHFKGSRAIAEVHDKDGIAVTIGVDLDVEVPQASVSCRGFLEVLKFADAFGFSDGSLRRMSFRFAGGRGIVAGQAANERGAFHGSLDLERSVRSDAKP